MSTEKHTFFCADPDSGVLSPEESNHAVRVLRLDQGMLIGLLDGKGNYHVAEIKIAHKKSLAFEIIETDSAKPKKPQLHIAIAPTKSMDRFSFFVEKAIEIGVQRITPLLCSNSERKTINEEKLIKQAIGALKQSGQYYLTQIDPLQSLNSFFDNIESDQQRFIAHCENDHTKKALFQNCNVDKNILILIGPEGDFTPEEITLAKENGFLPVSLGESRLRTETAGIVACHTVSLLSS
jgi:16S rRNA (uracil1498-N3)-methyltransferase